MTTTGEPVAFDSGGLTLEGRLHLPDGPPARAAVAVCHPHPLYGGDMNNNIVVALCRALAAGGLAALRFNFRGAGGSAGSHSGGPGEREDAVAALDHLESRRYGPLALAGYSFGAAVALAAASDPRVVAAAVVSLPVRFGRLEAPAGTAPLLMVSGSRDAYSPPEDVRALAAGMGARCRLEIIEGADHFWWGGEDRVAETVVPFLTQALA